MLPRTAGTVVGIEDDVLDAESPQVERRRQPCLTGSDHDAAEDVLHAQVNAAVAPVIPVRAVRAIVAEPTTREPS